MRTGIITENGYGADADGNRGQNITYSDGIIDEESLTENDIENIKEQIIEYIINDNDYKYIIKYLKFNFKLYDETIEEINEDCEDLDIEILFDDLYNSIKEELYENGNVSDKVFDKEDAIKLDEFFSKLKGKIKRVRNKDKIQDNSFNI